jgi:hypothetical protein
VSQWKGASQARTARSAFGQEREGCGRVFFLGRQRPLA